MAVAKTMRTWLAVLGMILLPCAAGALIYSAFPDAAACAVVTLGPFERAQVNVLVEAEVTAAVRSDIQRLTVEARARIESAFGTPDANPTFVVLASDERFGLSALEQTASTSFAPNRSCIVIGPRGLNLDVIAHELMHAELVERVGFQRKISGLPAWFEEGVAMQVDYREEFASPMQDDSLRSFAFVRELQSYPAFFGVPDDQLRLHYISAKSEVARSLSDSISLYDILDQIRHGASIDELMNEPNRPSVQQ